jgi:hypothetical protein
MATSCHYVTVLRITVEFATDEAAQAKEAV